MTTIAFAAWLLCASVPLVDVDQQPACRARCDEVYAGEYQACADQGYQVDECRSAADDRHQECIDRCNDD